MLICNPYLLQILFLSIGTNIVVFRPGSKTSFGHSREDLSEGHGSFLDSPVAPLSPTPSDADSGIYSTKTDHRSDLGESRLQNQKEQALLI